MTYSVKINITLPAQVTTGNPTGFGFTNHVFRVEIDTEKLRPIAFRARQNKKRKSVEGSGAFTVEFLS